MKYIPDEVMQLVKKAKLEHIAVVLNVLFVRYCEDEGFDEDEVSFEDWFNEILIPNK